MIVSRGVTYQPTLGATVVANGIDADAHVIPALS